MNDFTKKELIELQDQLNGDGGLLSESEYQTLANKLQSLIDCYCEHDETWLDLDCNPTRCKKCMEIVDE